MPDVDDKLILLGVTGAEIRRLGKGAKLAIIRGHAHRQFQAARVEPAMFALKQRRRSVSETRVARWCASHLAQDLSTAPRHIRLMDIGR
jgi:hypothetical protein